MGISGKNSNKVDMIFVKYSISVFLFFCIKCLLATEVSNIPRNKTEELKSHLFCEYVGIILSQNRRAYFGNNDFYLEEKIKNMWNIYLNKFILSHKIFDIKFMIIQFGGFISPKNFSYIVTDDTIYRFYFDIEFEQNVEKSVQFSKIRIKSTDRYELFENISNLKNNYFIMDNRLWIIGNNPRVFCVFTEAIGRNKFIGSYAIRYPETELDKFIFKLDNVFKNAENIKD